MYVACSTLCFAKHTLDECLKLIRTLRFAKVDLAVRPHGASLTPAEVAADVGRTVQRVKVGNVPVAAVHLIPGDTDPKGDLHAVCRMARLLAAPVVCVPAAPAGTPLPAELARLGEWCKLAAAEGVILTVETAAGTLTATPDGAAELCRRLPGLGLTLDPSHYTADTATDPVNYDHLFPFVRHVRLRDTGRGKDQFQLRVGQGDIEYGRIVTQLERFNYARALTVDVRDVADSPFPVEPEVRKLKYLLESLV
jgi:sugar phosphate isomerase/epimerase